MKVNAMENDADDSMKSSRPTILSLMDENREAIMKHVDIDADITNCEEVSSVEELCAYLAKEENMSYVAGFDMVMVMLSTNDLLN